MKSVPALLHKVLFISLAIVSIFLLSCTPAEKQCSTDSDCVPNKCCGGTDGINKNYGPNCQGILCAQVCTPGTISCNQGEIKCVSGECTAVFHENP